MQVDTIRRYPSRQAAQAVVDQANKLVTFAQYHITRDPVEEHDRKRGVGDYAVWFQTADCRPLTHTEQSRANSILDQAEARALAIKLAEYNPRDLLLRTWSLNPENQPHKWNFRP